MTRENGKPYNQSEKIGIKEFFLTPFIRVGGLLIWVLFFGVPFLLFWIVAFFIPRALHKRIMTLFYDHEGAVILHSNSSEMAFTFCLLISLFFGLLLYYRKRSLKIDPNSVPELTTKRKIVFYLIVFLTLVFLVWSLLTHAVLHLDRGQIEIRTALHSTRYFQFTDIDAIELHHDFNQGGRGGRFGSVNFRFKNGEKVSVDGIENENYVWSVLILNQDAKCYATSEFDNQKTAIFKGSTKRQYFSKILRNVIQNTDMKIPPACKWLVDDSKPAPRLEK